MNISGFFLNNLLKRLKLAFWELWEEIKLALYYIGNTGASDWKLLTYAYPTKSQPT